MAIFCSDVKWSETTIILTLHISKSKQTAALVYILKEIATCYICIWRKMSIFYQINKFMWLKMLPCDVKKISTYMLSNHLCIWKKLGSALKWMQKYPENFDPFSMSNCPISKWPCLQVMLHMSTRKRDKQFRRWLTN